MQILNRLFLSALLCVFAGCAGAHGAFVPRAPLDSTGGMPGDSTGGMPGASLPCGLTQQPAQASCTIAININIPAINIANLLPSLIPGLHPSDLRSAYALPSANAGATVAVVDAYDDPFAESDLAVYRLAFGLPPCTSLNGCFRKVNQSGQPGPYPAANLGWSQEIALDLEMVSAACPHCSIVLVEANSALMDDLGAGVDTAAALGAKAISNSYYAPEWPNESAEDVHYNHPGVAITASSGDQTQPSYPAASQYVTSVGGTSLSNVLGAWHETAWPYSGRGCSLYVAKPEWQSTAACATRSAVDVALVADPQTGVAVFDTLAGGWVVAGGTSVGAPIVAAAYALSGNPQSPAFSYAYPGAFHELGSGGYDLATGLGSPRGIAGF